MRISEARALAREWQKVLGVAHWKIHVRWAKPGDRVDDCYGCCEWFTEEANAAVILNRSRADEETIVHELLHVAFEGHLSDSKPYDPLYEQAINRLAKVLVAAKPCLIREV
jgi:hypothetical protein